MIRRIWIVTVGLALLPATLPANDSPMQVRIGNPAHSASLAVVWAL